MSKIIVTTLEGEVKSVDAKAGLSVMKNIRNAGVDGLLATCGGKCECGTCHVYVDAAWAAKLPKMSNDESDLLEDSDHHRPESRLSCQINFQDALDGLAVSIAPQD